MSVSNQQQQEQAEGSLGSPRFYVLVTYNPSNDSFVPEGVKENVTDSSLTSIVQIVVAGTADPGELSIEAGEGTPAVSTAYLLSARTFTVTFPHPPIDYQAYRWELSFGPGIVVKLSVKIRKTPVRGDDKSPG